MGSCSVHSTKYIVGYQKVEYVPVGNHLVTYLPYIIFLVILVFYVMLFWEKQKFLTLPGLDLRTLVSHTNSCAQTLELWARKLSLWEKRFIKMSLSV
jgi:hypothetical protein